MAHLLHVDSSIQGDNSVSRRLTARAARRWLQAHPGGEVTYRDFGAEPPPHLDAVAGLARMLPPDTHGPEQASSYALSLELVEEIRRADTLILGLPLYNFGVASSVKAWVDHLIVPGVSFDPETNTGLLGDTELIAIATRGGGYAPETPREGWDHAQAWLPHGLALTGLQPRFIVAELTLARVDPAMAHLTELVDESLAAAEREIDVLWESAVAPA